MLTRDVVDLFGGAGGWEVAARALGLDPLGVEWDAAACETREAAGLRTLKADVAALDPADFAPVGGVIGSPPCPTFSAAGQRGGGHLTEVILACAEALADGRDGRAAAIEDARLTLEPVTRATEVRRAEQDGREPRLDRARERAARDATMSMLVVEPVRWVRELRPAWVALEQVPEVLPLWEAFASIFEGWGYWTWAGLLHAEQYGVPQTRTRAFVIASAARPVEAPAPTHRRYLPPNRRGKAEHTLEEQFLEPWVSMAEALGWGMTARPSVSVLAKAGGTGGHRPLEGGSGARETLDRARREGDWEKPEAYDQRQGRTQPDGTRRMGPVRPIGEPAPTLRAAGLAKGGDVWRLRANGRPNATVRREDEPAPTITGAHDRADRVWEPDDEVGFPRRNDTDDGGEYRERDRRRASEPAFAVTEKARSWDRIPAEDISVVDTGNTRSGTRPEGRERAADQPAVSITTRADQIERRAWVSERPATTVAGDSRVHPPGHKENAADPPGKFEQRRGANAIRVTVEEAATLQSFPDGYPWQGTRTRQFQQVGNAIPPLLAWAVLKEAIG